MVDNKRENSTNNVHGQETNDTVTSSASARAATGEKDSAVTTGQKARPNSSTEGSRTIATTQEEIDDLVHKLDFGVAKSLRYHAKRRRFFETWHNVGMASAVFSAVSAFIVVTGDLPGEAKWIAVIFAAVTLIDLILGFYRRAQAHAGLRQRFSSLAGEIAAVIDPSEQNYRGWKVERLRIEADEPPALGTLDVICHNDEAESRGLKDDMHKLRWIDRRLAAYIDLRSSYTE